MPTLDRNSIGLNAVCCGLFIDKSFRHANPRVGQTVGVLRQKVFVSGNQNSQGHCARNIVMFVETEGFVGRWGAIRHTLVCFLRRIVACTAERQWTSVSFFMRGKSGKLRRDVLYSVGLCKNRWRKAAAK